MRRRLMVIGLDCVPPAFAFDRFSLPNLRTLMNRGSYGALESIVPPITVPAWACMVTGEDPGGLGIYGFRNRTDHTYAGLGVVTSHSVKAPAVWDVLGAHGKRSIVVGVPPAYPPRPLRGVAISCFLTPSAESQYAYPQEVKGELEHAVGPYLFDVPDFRTDDKQRLLDLVYRVTEYKFAASRHLATHHEWDFFMLVDIGPDRLHHGFWKYCDPEHLKHEPGNPLRSAFEDYYRFLDVQVGTLLESLDDRTAVLVVSDHGAKRMDGGICLNEWLINEGYLVLRAGPTGPTRFEDAQVDWSRTAVWGEGGYYGRIFLNVKGREPAGTIPPSRYEALRDELIQKLEALGDEAGRPLGTRVYRPEELYPVRRGIAPDLIAIFGDLHWRSVGSVGLGSVWSRENDTGPDDANHAQQGIMIEAGIGLGMGRRDGMRLVDLSPIMLECFGIRH